MDEKKTRRIHDSLKFISNDEYAQLDGPEKTISLSSCSTRVDVVLLLFPGGLPSPGPSVDA